MGSPISGITAKIFLQHLELFHIKSLLDSKHITFYARCVDDILIIYDASRTDLDAIAQYSNSIHRNLQLNPTLEANNRINFLDISIIRKVSQLEIDICHKPTTTDTTINYLFNHPSEHELVAYRYYIERMFSIPLNNDRLHSGWQTILHITKNNKFPTTLLHKLKHQIQHRIKHTTPPTSTENNTKWATFTFTFPHIRKITDLFNHTNVTIAFRCNNTIAKFTKPPNVHKIPPHNKWGIYQLTCISCDLSYVGQTSRSLKICYLEHIRYIRNNNPQSAYTQHILCNQHECSMMNNLMTLLKPLKNPNMLTPYEQFYLQALHQEGKLIPEQCEGDPNPLFQLAIHPTHTPHERAS